MITRLRVEAKAESRDALVDKLTAAIGCLIRFASEDQPEGEWECTQDVISGVPGNYEGRMIMVYRVT